MESEKTRNFQSNLEEKEQSWKYDVAWLKTILQN